MTKFLTLSFVLLSACTAASPDDPLADDDLAGGKADGATAIVVNGHTLNAREARWMRYVADHVLPDIPGTRARKLEIASRTAWWSLKEGIFDTQNAPRYSLCNSASGDHSIGPLDTCGSGRAWQVGLAAVQVPNHSLAELQGLAQELYPDQTIEEVLADAAAEAGEPADEIQSATGSLEKSWLLRRSAIGFVACERNEVVPECIDNSLSWCYGTGWDTTRLYAPNRTAAMRAIEDIAHALDQLSGAPPPPWIGSPCQTTADCGFTNGYCFVGDGHTAGFCSETCEGYCPDAPGRATTFCVAAPTGGGTCAVKAGPLDHDCGDLPGTQPTVMERYVGASSAPAATATVCTY